jgi:aspartyl aminopeptidase
MARKPQSTRKTDLSFKRQNGWLGLSTKDARRLETFNQDYLSFISRAKTEREAHDLALAAAKAKGYRPLSDWRDKGAKLQAGDKVYHSVRGKVLVLVMVGDRPLAEGLRIVGAHMDSPRLDLKPRPLYEDGHMALLDTHYYGGVKKYQWVAIPLALHGVVAKRDGTVVPVVIGEDPGDPVFCVTDLLPHLGKDQAERKLGDGITGEGLNLLCGSRPDPKGGDKPGIKTHILRLLNEKYGIDEGDLTSAELEVVPAGPGRELGLDRSMILAYAHDDRVCAYTALRGLLDVTKTPPVSACCILVDKEEIGSYGATGMQSNLVENFIAELVSLQDGPPVELAWRRCLRESKVLSADVNALHDPNYPEVSSPNDNMGRLNHGVIVTKYGGARGKSGSSDASAEYLGWLRGVFDDAGVVWQTGELGKVDQGGGGTIAYMLARYEADVVDCGPGVLSMHAPWEVAGKLDIYMTWKAYHTFYSSI